METLRTPDERFVNLPDFDFKPHYAEIKAEDGTPLRVHYLDEGPRDGEIVLCMHGEPSWSYLYRKMIPVLTKGGKRVLAPDLIGFGRSDKPAQQSDYTYTRHVGWMHAWMHKVGLKDATFFGQDWGGLIGLRLVADHTDLFTRIVVGNTGLPTGEGASDAFLAWRKFSQETPDFNAGGIVSMATTSDMPPEIVAAYNAPFPDDTYKAGARVFPTLVPVEAGVDGVAENIKAWKVFDKWEKPLLCTFSDSDPVTQGGEKIFQKRVPGAKGQPHTVIKNAGHFLQEDKGAELARVILDFMEATA